MRLQDLSHWSIPSNCMICQIIGQHSPVNLCTDCKDELPNIPHQCLRCALPMPSTERRCGRCLKHPPGFDYAFSALIYQPPASNLIHKIKQGYDQTAIPALADIFCERLYVHPFWAEFIPAIQATETQTNVAQATMVPIPIHWRRYLKRGYNQTLELSQHVGNTLGFPVNKRILKRISHSSPQQGQSRKERLRNLQGAFSADQPLSDGKTIILMDDVMTTGATLDAAAKALKQAGATSVLAWSLARTPYP